MSQKALLAISLDAPITSFDILDNFEGRSGKFIKGFLLNTKRNKNGWKVSWDSIKKNASDFINHPGIYYEPTEDEPDHTGGRTYRENMANQEGFRVVNIVSVSLDEAGQTLNYVGEILDEDFEALWEAGKINMTSPAVWPEEMEQVGTMENGAPMLDVDKWRALHIAYINDPAYGDDAVTLATCDGEGEACRIRLSAKNNPCGLCAQNDLAPLQEVPLIRRKLKREFSAEGIAKIHSQYAAMTAQDNNCVSDKLKIIMEDNPDMEKDQQLAIAYAYCKASIVADLLKKP